MMNRMAHVWQSYFQDNGITAHYTKPACLLHEGGQYTPAFFLPWPSSYRKQRTRGIWVDISETPISLTDRVRLHRYAISRKCHGLILVGDDTTHWSAHMLHYDGEHNHEFDMECCLFSDYPRRMIDIFADLSCGRNRKGRV